MSNTFELISKSPENYLIPIEKYISNRTGIKLYVCNIKGPVVDGYISLSTEAFDDDGLPHTLEHMVFLGSEDYPYPGILDILANKVYAAGTNAWTDVDNTSYMLSTVEKLGFLQLLPIYLDHILYPLLNESGFITEVYHVNGEGEDAGVVYSEMQSCENEDDTIVDRTMHKLMYPNSDCGYRYETGGVLNNLRTTTTHARVREYHKNNYRPNNMAIIIAGDIEANEIIEVVEKFEEKILSKNPDSWKINNKPFSKSIEPLTSSINEVVHFPCDSEKSSHGIVSIGVRGPHINDLDGLIALDLIFTYLTDSSISTLQSYFIEKNSLCNKINYSIEEYKESFVMISFVNTQLNALHEIKDRFDEIINDLIEKKIEFDTNRMRSIIEQKILEITDKLEDSPHDTISRLCIGDFLYGDNNELQFQKRFLQADILRKFQNENESFWLGLVEKWIHKTNKVTVIAKPSEQLMHSIGDENKRRVSERKSQLGKKGLRELEIKLKNAIDENDNDEVPDDIYDQLTVPSLENLKFKKIQQYDNLNSDGIKNLINFENLNHLQLQVDHLEDTNFVQLALMIDTNDIDEKLRKYLQLFMKLIFELPIHNENVSLTHDEVVREIHKELLEFDAAIGIDGEELDFGIYPQYLWIYIKVSLKQFENSIKWLRYVLFDCVFDKSEVKTGVEKLLKEIVHRKQAPLDILQCVLNEIIYKNNSNSCLNGLIRQEKFLKDEVVSKLEETGNDEVIQYLNNLKKALLTDVRLRFYICSNLHKLNEELKNKNTFDEIICKYFPKSLLNSNVVFQIKQTWQLRNPCYNEEIINLPKNDYIVGLGATESSYLRITAPIAINSYKHQDYPGLLVLKEYFCQTEGPLWEAVRGPGYAYYQQINVSPENGLVELCLDECSNVVKAFDATRKMLIEHLNEDVFDEQLLETSKNSLIFMLIDNLKSVSNLSQHSLSCIFKGIDIDSVKVLFKNIQEIEVKDLQPLLKRYLMPLFNDSLSNCVVVCNPSKLDNILNDFNQKFERTLVNVNKLDEWFEKK